MSKKLDVEKLLLEKDKEIQMLLRDNTVLAQTLNNFALKFINHQTTGPKGISGWPYHHFPVKKHISTVKSNIESLKLKNFVFFGYQQVQNLKDIWKVYKSQDSCDGQIIVSLAAEFAALGPDLGKLLEKGIPSIIYTLPFSVYYDGYACVRNSNAKVCVVASSNANDLRDALNGIQTVKKLKNLRLLVVRDLQNDYTKIEKEMLDPSRWKGPAYCKMIQDSFGVKVIFCEARELNYYYGVVDEEVIKKDLKELNLNKNKKKLKEPNLNDVKKAIKMYHALKLLMRKKGANGITVDCLSYIRQKTLPVSPCYAISRLLKEGIVTGCEADVESVICLAINLFLTNTPGFQGDPVIDRKHGMLMIAHCTASPRMCSTNVDVEDCDMFFRTHNESHSDVGIEVKMPINKPITIFKVIKTGKISYVGKPTVFTSVKEEGYKIICDEAMAVAPKVKDSEWGCRTKVGVKLPEEELDEFEENFFGHHRIVVYGKHKKRIRILAKLLGIKFVPKMYLIGHKDK